MIQASLFLFSMSVLLFLKHRYLSGEWNSLYFQFWITGVMTGAAIVAAFLIGCRKVNQNDA